MKELSLPPLSKELLGRLSESISKHLHLFPNKGLDESYKNRNIVSINYGYLKDIDSDINDELENIYSKYFNEPIVFGAGRMKNTNPETVAQVQPHVDGKEKRWTAINCYLKLGGDQVRTNFYTTELTGANSLPYEDVVLDESYVLDQNKWYSFDSQQYHGVDNVETERSLVLIMINYPNSMPYDDFILKYNNLIKQDVK